MPTLPDLLRSCDAVVRNHLESDEHVLAIGRCEDITQRGGSIDRGGAAWTYIMVTDRKLRWVPHANLRFEASLELDAVSAVSERLVKHRYGIAMTHAPLSRPHWVPKHRILIFEWGNAIVTTPLGRTKLAFSRRDTEAALALQNQLAVRTLL